MSKQTNLFGLTQKKMVNELLLSALKPLFNSDTDESDVVIRLSNSFRANYLLLPKQKNILKLNQKFIAKTPFYVCLLMWLYAVASLLK